MSINKKELIGMLVESGKFDKKVASEKVDAVIAAIEKALPGSEDATIEKMARRQIQKVVSVPPSDKFMGVCVAYTERADSNDYSRKKALAMYDQDPMMAVQEGYVKVVGEEVTALDNRRFIDKAGKMENRMFGKPFPVRMQREVVFIVGDDGDYKITRAFGDVNPEIGQQYEIYGKMTGGGNITIAKRPGIRPMGAVENVWDLLYEVASESEYAVGIADIADLGKNTFVVICGIVRYSGETAVGSMLIVSDEDNENSIAAFAFTGDCAESMLVCEPDTEVIVIGRVGEGKDPENPGEIRKNINAIGVIPNPESMKAVDALKDIDEIFFE